MTLRWLASLIACSLCSSSIPASAALVVGYDISDSVPVSAGSNVGPGVTAMNVTLHGLTSANTLGESLLIDGWNNTAGQYVEFGFSGSVDLVDLTLVTLGTNSIGGGPSALRLEAAANGGSFIQIGTAQNVGAMAFDVGAVAGFDQIQSATFRLFDASGATGGTLSIDGSYIAFPAPPAGINLAVQGSFTAVPEPHGLMLVGLGLLLRRRPRHKH